MPSAVDKLTAASPTTATNSNPSSNNNHDDDENTDYTHLADAYNEPLYIYPRDDPTPAMKKAYASQKVSRQIYTSARKDREEYELSTSTELGQLYNSLRESNERERTVLKTLREKTIAVYDLELRADNDNDDDETNDTRVLGGGYGTFNQGITKLKSYLKKHKSLPDNLSDNVVSRELASWIENMQNNNDLRSHQRAALEHLGVIFSPTNENDTWHRNLVQFQLYSKEYYETPIKVQTTNGNVLHSIALDSGSSSGGSDDNDNSDNKITVLNKWCSAQQAQYELDGYQSNQDRYIKLVNAGFTFDVIIDDTKWDTYVEKVKEFREQFGHVHVPIDYVPKEKGDGAATATDSSTNTTSLNLSEFVTKVRTLILRDALSPNRLNDIKKAEVYIHMGGRVYNEHITACKAGRAEREEEGERTKRKFGALEVMAATGEIANKKVVIRRNNMDNWKARLDKLIAYKNEHGNVIDIKNDVKLRMWVYSIVRKLSINSSALKGEKMKLIEEYDGLKEFLLRKDHLDAAQADAKARKDKDGGEGETTADGAAGAGADMMEDILLGKKEDHELNAFMEKV